MRTIGFFEIAVPLGFVVATIPGSFYFILMGGAVVFAPFIAFGMLGLSFGRAVRNGRSFFTASIFELVQAGACAALALHSVTWTATNRFQEVTFPILTAMFWCVVIGSVSVPLLLVVSTPEPRYDGDQRPVLYPWLIVALIGLAAVAVMCGITVTGEG